MATRDPMGAIFGGGTNRKIPFNYRRYERYNARSAGRSPAAGNPYFDTEHHYGSPFGQGNSGRNARNRAGVFSGISQYSIQQNPDTWQRYRMTNAGLETNSASGLMGRFFSQQMGEVENAYQMALLRNPFLTFREFYRGAMNQGERGGGVRNTLMQRWNEALPAARGESLGTYQGPTRWQIPYM